MVGRNAYHTGMDSPRSPVFQRQTDDRPIRQDRRETFPIADADRCVKCALCLPHCPTYRHSLDENESPRGRIALMQGIARGELEASGKATAHLERCLACRNCEPVCPAEVPYGRLIDAARHMVRDTAHRSRRERLAATILGSPRGLGFLAGILRLWDRSGLRHLARALLFWWLAPLRRLDQLLPSPMPARPRRRFHKARKDSIQLFLGCIAEELDPGVSTAIRDLLEAVGHDVVIPPGQACCGAPKQHGGDPEGAAMLARRNREAFDTRQPILASASGCTATLREAPEIAEGMEGFAAAVTDATQFLDRELPGAEAFTPLPGRAVFHAPCSQRNVLGATGAGPALAERIPQLEVRTLESRGQCCGAAGTYVLGQPALSQTLGEETAAQIEALQPDLVLTTNIGCKLQLRAALARRLPNCRVLHPAELLAQQWAGEPSTHPQANEETTNPKAHVTH